MSGRIDFNCDLGEGCGDDAAILPYVTSANIACGGHAGDEASMRETLRLCRAHGVAAGAHPGYEDREHFGRRALALAHDEVAALVTRQFARLAAIADEEGVALTHLKPHGALYNLAADDRGVAEAIAGAVAQCDPRLIVFGLAQSDVLTARPFPASRRSRPQALDPRACRCLLNAFSRAACATFGFRFSPSSFRDPRGDRAVARAGARR